MAAMIEMRIKWRAIRFVVGFETRRWTPACLAGPRDATDGRGVVFGRSRCAVEVLLSARTRRGVVVSRLEKHCWLEIWIVTVRD